ncbi:MULTISPECIES: hypothetical protein [unclassified Mesorhizobium]|uniref:hypothetical protein n=1 Tax=unclassified Mesorhizobium TaxID=325217 RepID=UPI00333C31BD
MRVLIGLALACTMVVGSSNSSLSQEAKKEQDFRTGQTMAECAAFFRLAAQLYASKPSLAEQANNKANGWELAATLFILNGSSEEQQFHVKETMQHIVDAKKTEYLARVESLGAKGFEDISKEFNETCMPMVPLQEKVIEVMRRG